MLSTSQVIGLVALAAVVVCWKFRSGRGLGGPAVPAEVVAAYSLEATKSAAAPAPESPAARAPRNGRPKNKR